MLKMILLFKRWSVKNLNNVLFWQLLIVCQLWCILIRYLWWREGKLLNLDRLPNFKTKKKDGTRKWLKKTRNNFFHDSLYQYYEVVFFCERKRFWIFEEVFSCFVWRNMKQDKHVLIEMKFSLKFSWKGEIVHNNFDNVQKNKNLSI